MTGRPGSKTRKPKLTERQPCQRGLCLIAMRLTQGTGIETLESAASNPPPMGRDMLL